MQLGWASFKTHPEGPKYHISFYFIHLRCGVPRKPTGWRWSMTTLLLLVTDEVREWKCGRKPIGVCVPLLEHLMINIQSSLRGTNRWWEDWNSHRAEGFRHTEQDGKILGQLWRKRWENLKFLLLVVSQLLKLPHRLLYLCEAFIGLYGKPRSLGHWHLVSVSEWFLGS